MLVWMGEGGAGIGTGRKYRLEVAGVLGGSRHNASSRRFWKDFAHHFAHWEKLGLSRA